jgi:hypothetical protein
VSTRWTDASLRWPRVMTLLRRLEELIAALPHDDAIEDAAYVRATMRADRLHQSIIEELEREHRRRLDAATGSLNPLDQRADDIEGNGLAVKRVSEHDKPRG